MSAGSPSKRRDTDLMKLMMSGYDVEIMDETNASDFCVQFKGPDGTPYEGGTWRVQCTLPMEYPFKSPSIGFRNPIFHPNIDERSGSVCLDVINQTWSPMFDLVNIFTVFLPQLLTYGNPSDPLNGDAAGLMMRDPKGYETAIREHVAKFASGVPLVDGKSAAVSSNEEDDLEDDGFASDISELSDMSV